MPSTLTTEPQIKFNRIEEQLALGLPTPQQKKILNTLPLSVLNEYRKFIDLVYTTRFFNVDKKPDPLWVKICASTWEEARNDAILKYSQDSLANLPHNVKSNGHSPEFYNSYGFMAEKLLINLIIDSERFEVYEVVHKIVDTILTNGYLSVLQRGHANRVDEHTATAAEGRDILRNMNLMAHLTLVKDFEFPSKEKYSRHIQQRVNAWQKGYGVIGDVNGLLYVYCKADSK
jgi:hypothetical protein